MDIPERSSAEVDAEVGVESGSDVDRRGSGERGTEVEPDRSGDAAAEAAATVASDPVVDGPADAVADGKEKKLDPRSVHAARTVGGLLLLVVLAGGVPVVGMMALAGSPALKVVLPIWGVVATMMAFFGLVFPAVSFRYTSYRVNAEGIRIRRGVIWRSEVTVPRSRVQHTDVSRGPIERYFELATLVIHTAGTQHASVSLGGLSAEDAYPIRDYLLDGGVGDAV